MPDLHISFVGTLPWSDAELQATSGALAAKVESFNGELAQHVARCQECAEADWGTMASGHIPLPWDVVAAHLHDDRLSLLRRGRAICEAIDAYYGNLESSRSAEYSRTVSSNEEKRSARRDELVERGHCAHHEPGKVSVEHFANQHPEVVAGDRTASGLLSLQASIQEWAMTNRATLAKFKSELAKMKQTAMAGLV